MRTGEDFDSGRRMANSPKKVFFCALSNFEAHDNPPSA